MANYNSLKATINANIKTNGNQEITGYVLNSVLNDIVTTLGAGYQYAGVANQSTNPGTPDARVFYLAAKGTYPYFGNTEITDGSLGVFRYDSEWHYDIVDVIDVVENYDGGVGKALSAELGKDLNDRLVKLIQLVGEGEEQSVSVPATWVQGSIAWDDGQNISSTTSIRSSFLSIGNTHTLHVTCDSGYFIKAVFAYNTSSLSDFNRVIYRGNASGEMDTSKTTIDVDPGGLFIRLVCGKQNGNTITASDGSHIHVTDVWDGIGEKTLVEHVTDLETAVDYISTIPADSRTIIPSVADTYVALDGSLVGQTPTYKTTDFIPVNEGDVFTYIGFAGSLALACAGYNSSSVFVQSLLGSGNYDDNMQTITIPSGISKIRFCGRIDTHPLDIRQVSGTTEQLRDVVIGLRSDVNYFKGKVLYVLGDSIAAGSVQSGTAPSKPFPTLVAEKLGLSLVNYGIGGSSVAVAEGNGGMFASLADLQAATKVAGKYYCVLTGNQTYQVYYWNGSSLSTSTRKLRTPASQRYAFLGDDADIVIVEVGTNDFQYNWTPVGSMADRTEDTFYGAMHVLCQGLLGKYLGKLIIFMTPIKRAQTQLDTGADTTAHQGGSYGSTDSQNLFGKTLGDYCEIIQEVCRYYSIPVIDMYSFSLLNPSLASQASLFDNYKTHPFQNGHNIMARLIVGQMKAIAGAFFQ